MQRKALPRHGVARVVDYVPLQDLTTGSVTRHLLKTTSFMLVTMVFQTLYFLVDLYWVGPAREGSGGRRRHRGNLTFIVLAITQMLGGGTTTLVSHAAGHKDRSTRAARLQRSRRCCRSSSACFFWSSVWRCASPYVNALGADAQTAALAADYLLWFIPAMALQFPMVAMGAALRGTGNFKPGMVVPTATVILNIVLAPVSDFRLGRTGRHWAWRARLASFVAIVDRRRSGWRSTSCRTTSYLKFIAATGGRDCRHVEEDAGDRAAGRRRVRLIAVYLFVVYVMSRPFGAAAQAGFGIGMRIVQAGFMPVVALGFAVGAGGGPEFRRAQGRPGAGDVQSRRHHGRRRDGAAVTIACLVAGEEMVRRLLSRSRRHRRRRRVPAHRLLDLRGLGRDLRRTRSMFQAMGNTIPALIASFTRILLVAIPAFLLSRLPGFQLHWIWYLSVGATNVQLALNLLLLRREFSASGVLIGLTILQAQIHFSILLGTNRQGYSSQSSSCSRSQTACGLRCRRS